MEIKFSINIGYREEGMSRAFRGVNSKSCEYYPETDRMYSGEKTCNGMFTSGFYMLDTSSNVTVFSAGSYYTISC